MMAIKPSSAPFNTASVSLVLMIVCFCGSVNSQFRFLRSNSNQELPPEVHLSSPDLIRTRGYPLEIHRVVTEDGYILELHRIPRPGRMPVYFQHGLMATNGRWLMNPPNSSLVFSLADKGYDVWLGNARGNTYSRYHVSLDASQPEYWDYTFDDMGRYDVPTMLSYVLKKTSRPKLIYVADSLGCTAFFMAMNYRPELNQRIAVMFALAPSTSVGHIRDPMLKNFVVPLYEPIRFFLKLTNGNKEYFGDVHDADPVTSMAERLMCRRRDACPEVAAQMLLYRLLFLRRVNREVTRHWPTGTSMKSLEQYVQNIRSGVGWKAYDYGKEENLRHYGTEEPYFYDLKRVTAPVYLFWSPHDDYATEKDIQWVASNLGNLKALITVPDEGFTHFDFITGDKVHNAINRPIMSLMPPPQ